MVAPWKYAFEHILHVSFVCKKMTQQNTHQYAMIFASVNFFLYASINKTNRFVKYNINSHSISTRSFLLCFPPACCCCFADDVCCQPLTTVCFLCCCWNHKAHGPAVAAFAGADADRYPFKNLIRYAFRQIAIFALLNYMLYGTVLIYLYMVGDCEVYIWSEFIELLSLAELAIHSHLYALWILNLLLLVAPQSIRRPNQTHKSKALYCTVFTNWTPSTRKCINSWMMENLHYMLRIVYTCRTILIGFHRIIFTATTLFSKYIPNCEHTLLLSVDLKQHIHTRINTDTWNTRVYTLKYDIFCLFEMINNTKATCKYGGIQ